MGFTRENARENLPDSLAILKNIFGDLVVGETGASPLSADGGTVLGACGLPFSAPVTDYLRVDPVVGAFLAERGEENGMFVFGKSVRYVTASGKVKLPKAVRKSALSVCRAVLNAPGKIGEEGEHIIDIKHGGKIGTHFDVNLLIGNRIGYPDPMLTTPKGALDSLGRGCFRAGAAKQVTSTRYSLIAEYNGEQVNRQFYLVENGRQIFYSADTGVNVKSAECRHLRNRTVITYETECGLRITRTLFILPYEDGMPEAVEAQTVRIENLTKKPRTVKIVFTGMFGLATPESTMNDIIYASVTWESSLIKRDGKTVAVCPHPHPRYLKPNKRFALLLTDDGETLDGYTANYIDFIGNGTLEKPQRVAALANAPVTKMVPFFAIDKSLTLPARGAREVTSYVGIVTARGGADDPLFDALTVLIDSYRKPGAAAEALHRVIAFGDEYAGFLHVKTEDEDFNTYINRNLPFQVYYQSYVSRSFAWTQKAFREIGFREIQDMYASLYYIIGTGNTALAREMLSAWVKNVWEMGYANHNFYETGKEAGVCSDDGLWLAQAIYRYVSLSGDVEFLSEEYPMVGSEEKRTVLGTLVAILVYSGSISVGTHGLPLLDKADWNDCLKLDNDWVSGPEKEKRYAEQLKVTGAPYGTRLALDLSESVMNAFLLKIAYDDTAMLADMAGKGDVAEVLRKKCATLCDNIGKHCWKGDFYARALVGGKREGGYTFLGAKGDGLSADPEIDGTYYLNSFSWSIHAGVATEEQIATMLDPIEKYLVTPAGIKLCTNADLGKLSDGNASGSYFPGDRENGGVFKHAAMMAASACFKAAKTVRDRGLAERLANLAYFALDTVLPYRTLLHPYLTKGNPRFCTQYNNSQTGENIGPMLSGTASWLNLSVMELLGISYEGENLVFSPVLPSSMTHTEYTFGGKTRYHVTVEKPLGFARVGEMSAMTFDGAPFDGTIKREDDGKTHEIVIQLS
ncbi:MAG: glycosyl transferase [Ruminococcus sp.]|nr:glycosyl transferase [Candidatus Apopatosoma intestinale]